MANKSAKASSASSCRSLPLSRDSSSSACQVSGSKPISLRFGAMASVGYASLAVVAGYRQTGEEIIGLVHDATGSLKIDCELKSVEVGSEFFVPVRIENASRQSWVGTDHNPLNLAYHWLDQDGKAVVFDGERTAFPATKLEPNQTLSAQVRVVAPGLPGSYRLVLTPVQERHCWFDGCATFTPGVLDLFVVDRIYLSFQTSR